MPKVAKYILIGFAVLLVLVAAGIVVIVSTFDPNAYKAQIISLVRQQTQRTLAIPGDIKLIFFPNIKLELGLASLSERNVSTRFASVENVKVAFALLPLLSRRLIVDRIDISGLAVALRREKDGSSNYDDLLDHQEGSAQTVRFNIRSVTITNGKISFEDRMTQRKVEIEELNVQTGRIANAVPGDARLNGRVRSSSPQIDVNLAVKTKFNFDLERKRYAVDALEGQLKGVALGYTDLLMNVGGNADLHADARQLGLGGLTLAVTGKQGGEPFALSLEALRLVMIGNQLNGGNVSGTARLSPGGRTVDIIFTLPSLEGTWQAILLPALTLAATFKDASIEAKVSLAGDLVVHLNQLLFSSPALTATLSGKRGTTIMAGTVSGGITADLRSGRIDLPDIAIDSTLPNPGGGATKLIAYGSAAAELNSQNVMASLQGKLDESRFDATFGLAGFSPTAYTFDISVDKLDADRYRARTPADGAAASGKDNPGPDGQPDKPDKPDRPMDLSALSQLQASGHLRIGSFKAENIQFANLQLSLKAGGGRLDIEPLTASLYGGLMNGSLGMVVAAPVKFSMRQSLSGINLGLLMKDAIGKEPVEGRGNVTLDVTTEGSLVAQLKRNLNGKLRIELRDGAVKGFDIGQAIRSARNRVGTLRGDAPAQAGTGTVAERSDFSELKGSFRVIQGLARSEDLRAKSPLLRVAGSGNVDIGEDRLDFSIKATIVPTLQGQGGPELQALKGLTVPVRLSGPFTSISYEVDFTGMTESLVRKHLDKQKEMVKSRLELQLQEQLRKLFK